MRILILGDVVGRPGRSAIRDLVPGLIKTERIDLAIANAENSAGGMGVDIKSAEELLSAGAASSGRPTIPPAPRARGGSSGAASPA